MDMSIRFPHLGIYLPNVGKTISVFGFDIAYYGITIANRNDCGNLHMLCMRQNVPDKNQIPIWIY